MGTSHYSIRGAAHTYTIQYTNIKNYNYSTYYTYSTGIRVVFNTNDIL